MENIFGHGGERKGGGKDDPKDSRLAIGGCDGGSPRFITS